MRGYLESLESLSKSQLMLMLLRKRQDETDGIAVVGMACRLPGGISSPEQLWAAVNAGRTVPDETRAVPVDSRGRPRWNVEAPDLAPLADLLARGGYLDDVDVFDAEYFGIAEDEAPDLDPQQRQLLACAAEAVADANLTRGELGSRRVGVFTAASTIEYHQAQLRNGVNLGELSRYAASGGALSGAAGRVAACLGVDGPALTVDTACSSTLTALHLACASLRHRECDVALVGASHLLLSPWTTAAFARTGVLSDSGRCRPFTADADGYVRGEGAGVLVLQRFRDAESDGALPYAQVRGTAIHQHGERLTLTMSSAHSQRHVIDRALRQAQVAPEDVRYVEAQANGVKVAAVVEIEALAAAYRRTGTGAPDLYVGSCKANLGYLETASGLAGLIKVVMALRHGAIPPQPGADQLDPAAGWDRFPITVPPAAVPWPAAPRRLAAVSAFGFTGTDAHAVLEAVPERARPAEASAPALFVLSAHNPEALRATAARLSAYLRDRPEWTHTAICRTLAAGRDLRAVRAAAVVRDRTELLAQLSRLETAGSVPPSRTGAAGLSLRFDDVADHDLAAVLKASTAPGLDGLASILESTARTLGLAAEAGPPLATPAPSDRPGWTFAWALAWLDLLRALRLDVVAVEFNGDHSPLLTDVVTQRCTPEQAGARWRDEHRAEVRAAAADGRLGRWQVMDTAAGWTVRRRDQPAAAVPLDPARIEPEAWLGLVADQVTGGAPVHLAALWDRPRHGLVRLPPPAFTGKSYWPEHNRWS